MTWAAVSAEVYVLCGAAFPLLGGTALLAALSFELASNTDSRLAAAMTDGEA